MLKIPRKNPYSTIFGPHTPIFKKYTNPLKSTKIGVKVGFELTSQTQFSSNKLLSNWV